MDRKEFFKKACTLGICSCVGINLLFPEKSIAQTEDPQEQKEDWRFGFIQRRFASLLELMDKSIDPKIKNKIIEDLGRTCAKEYEANFIKYRNNLSQFIIDIKGQWFEDAIYDEEKNTIKLIGKQTDNCFCPFADKSITAKSFCDCTLGYQKQMFETIFDKPIEASILESVLRGGERCSFFIQFS